MVKGYRVVTEKTPLEIVAEEKTVERAKACGFIVRKLSFVGVRGGPDRLFGRNRRTVLIEFKRYGKAPTRQQQIRAQELREHCGWEVYWADNYAEACRILGITEE